MKSAVSSDRAPKPVGPYSQAVESGAVYCSGQIGMDPATGELEAGIVPQTRRAIENLSAVLSAAGLGLQSVVKTTVFLASMGDYAQMNEEYSRHFQAPYPARSTVQVAGLPRGALVEIDAIALK